MRVSRTAWWLGLLLVSPAAPSGAQSWRPLGPPGGDVRSLAADPRDPRRLYLGTADGVLYRSKDSGLHWERLSPGFPKRGMSLDGIQVDARGRVLVGYWEVAGPSGGVAASADEGVTFAVLPGMAGRSVRALAVAPWDPDALAAGTLDGVFRSTDGGATWQAMSPPGHRELRNVESVAFDPEDRGVLYAGTWHLPWKTADGGRTWRPMRAGIIDDSDIFTMNVDRRRRETLYATACTGLYRSQDAGATWTKLRGIPGDSRRTRAFAQSPERPDTLLAGTTEGLWISEDAGGSWTLTTSKTLVVNAISVLPGGRILLGCDGAGVLRSDNGGATWSSSNEGFSERFVSAVHFDHEGGRILAGIGGDRHHGGVMRRGAAGGPWDPLGAGLDGREVLCLGLLEGAPVAGTDDGVFVLEGQAWRRLPTVLPEGDVHPRVADLGTAEGSWLFAATSRGLLRSGDRGRSWEDRTPGPARKVVALVVSRGLVFAATPLGIYRSRDMGASWERASSGPPNARVHSLAPLPGSDDVLFATTPSGLFRSPDRGATWYLRGGGLPVSDITGLAFHPDGRTVYASDFSYGGIFRSQDAGVSWQPFTTEGLVSNRVWSIAVNPDDPERLMASTGTGGLQELDQAADVAASAAPPSARRP